MDLYLRPRSGSTWIGAPPAEAPGEGRGRGREERDGAKVGVPVRSAAAQGACTESQMGGKRDRGEIPQLEFLNVPSFMIVKSKCQFNTLTTHLSFIL